MYCRSFISRLFHNIINIPCILFVLIQWNLFEEKCRLIDRNQFAKKQLLAFCRFREGTFGNWSSETAGKYCVCIYWKDIKHARLNNIPIWIAKKSFCPEIESGLSRSGADSDKATSIGKAEEDGVQCNRRDPLKLKLRNCIPWNWDPRSFCWWAGFGGEFASSDSFPVVSHWNSNFQRQRMIHDSIVWKVAIPRVK